MTQPAIPVLASSRVRVQLVMYVFIMDWGGYRLELQVVLSSPSVSQDVGLTNHPDSGFFRG
jgi:hypothetical protein